MPKTIQPKTAPTPQKGMSFLAIPTPPPTKTRFQNKGSQDTKPLEAAARFLLSNFQSFDLSNFFQLTKFQEALDYGEIESWFLDWTDMLVAEGKLHKTELAGSFTWEVL
jgi:hypothetical protein